MSHHPTTADREGHPRQHAGRATPPAEPAPTAVRRRRPAGLAAASGFGWQYWTADRFQVSTNDAYVKADSTTVAPKVSGYLAAVLVGDNDQVAAGQVLARIDDRDFRAALAQAKAETAAAEASIATRRAALDAQQAAIKQARATIDLDTANQIFAQQDARRHATFAASGYGSVQNAQQPAARIAAAHAAVARDVAALSSATRQLDVLRAELAQAEAALARAQAAEAQAALNLPYITITAAVSGVVGNRTLRVGQYVQAGTQLMAVVPVDVAYIVANYKETQLTSVQARQPAEIRVDIHPGRVFHGHVDSLAPTSGQEFALLPPDNATGKLTKVVQRIPVRIVLDAAGRPAVVLRSRMSVTPTIDTRPTSDHRG